MKPNHLLLLALFYCTIIFSQVGINNTNPLATLDVVAIRTDGTTAEGVIPPRLTGDQIKLANSQYGTAQNGTIVYATTGITSADITGITSSITTPGLYYFTGTIWQSLSQTSGSVVFLSSIGNGDGLQINAIITADDFITVPLTVTKNIGGGVWNTTNYTYSVPISGTYLIKSSVRLVDGSASRNIFQSVHTDNIDIPDGIWQTSSGNRFTMLNTRIAYFNAGELLRLYIYSDGANANITDASLNIVLISQN